MPIYNLSDLAFTSPYFTSMDCVLHNQKGIYCSSELTSGLRAYKAMAEHGVKSGKALKQKLGEDWFKKNIEERNKEYAADFAKRILLETKREIPVINPGPLTVPSWGQPEYLAFWEELIRTRASEVRFNNDWEFSNGCTFEYVAANKLDIPTLDGSGKEITFRSALERIEAAISKFEGFDTKGLQVNLERLKKHPIELRQLDPAFKRVES